MKRKFACLLASLLVALSATGCSSSGNNEQSTSSNTTSQESESSSVSATQQDTGSTEPVDLYIEIITWGTEDPDTNEVFDKVNEITVPAIGARINPVMVSISEMTTKLGMMVASGETIDLVESGMLTTPTNLVTQGLLQPMTDYLSEDLVEMAGPTLEACMYQNEIYAYPNSTYVGNYSMFVYDAALAEEYNIEIPDSIQSAEEWEALFSQVKESGMPQYAISLGDGVNQELYWNPKLEGLGDSTTFAAGALLNMFDDDTTIVNYYATDEYKEICDMHRDWYEKGYAIPDSISSGYTTTDTLTQGTVFGYLTPVGANGGVKGLENTVGGKELGGILVGDGTMYASTRNVLSSCWSIAATSENPQAVCDFLDLMYTNTELSNLLNYGIEGKHYVTTEGSRIIDFPEGVDVTTVGYGHQGTSFGDLSNRYFRAPVTDEWVNNELEKYSLENTNFSKYMGYVFDETEYQAEMSNIRATISTYGPSLSCGTVDPDEVIPEFLQELESAGINDVIAANQEQFNDWLASK